MFRWVTTISFLTIILLQIAGKWLILADYALNREFIARTLCVNKSKPAMHCNGQCHLRKQLQKEENGDEQTPTRNSYPKFQEVVFETPAVVSFHMVTPEPIIPGTTNTALYTCQYIATVFHPPGV